TPTRASTLSRNVFYTAYHRCSETYSPSETAPYRVTYSPRDTAGLCWCSSPTNPLTPSPIHQIRTDTPTFSSPQTTSTLPGLRYSFASTPLDCGSRSILPFCGLCRRVAVHNLHRVQSAQRVWNSDIPTPVPVMPAGCRQ